MKSGASGFLEKVLYAYSFWIFTTTHTLTLHSSLNIVTKRLLSPSCHGNSSCQGHSVFILLDQGGVNSHSISHMTYQQQLMQVFTRSFLFLGHSVSNLFLPILALLLNLSCLFLLTFPICRCGNVRVQLYDLIFFPMYNHFLSDFTCSHGWKEKHFLSLFKCPVELISNIGVWNRIPNFFTSPILQTCFHHILLHWNKCQPYSNCAGQQSSSHRWGFFLPYIPPLNAPSNTVGPLVIIFSESKLFFYHFHCFLLIPTIYPSSLHYSKSLSNLSHCFCCYVIYYMLYVINCWFK